jgi:SAM-dependent methyltransferase
MACRVCGSSVREFFSLGKMPLANAFLEEQEIAKEKKYELSAGFCQQCYLVQLIDTISPNELFSDYLYFSSTSETFLQHCKNTAEYLTKKLELNSKSMVLEIGSNDGALLRYFQMLGIQVLGVDPAGNVAESAIACGIPTKTEFFTHTFAKKLRVQADLVYGANVLAHVPEIVDFVQGVRATLKQEGTAVFEFPYIRGLLEGKFDTIYHEHVFYYSMIALRNLFQKVNLELYDVEHIPLQGGSLRIFVCHKGMYPVSKNIQDLVEEEFKRGWDSIEAYTEIEQYARKLKIELISLLEKIKAQGKTIAAYSAPAKGNVLLNYFGITRNHLDFIVDKSQSKQGLYTPGTHFLVEPVKKIYEQKTDYLVILCWNIASEVMEQLKDYQSKGGKFIIPIPRLQII